MELGRASLALVVFMSAIWVYHAAADPSREIDVCARRDRCGYNIQSGLNVYCIKIYDPFEHHTTMITADEKCLNAFSACNDKARQEPFICHSGPCGCNSDDECEKGEPTMRPAPGPGPGPPTLPRFYGSRGRHRFMF